MFKVHISHCRPYWLWHTAGISSVQIIVDFPLERGRANCSVTPISVGGNINSPAGCLLHIPGWDWEESIAPRSAWYFLSSCHGAFSHQHPINRSPTQGEDQSRHRPSLYLYEINVGEYSDLRLWCFFLQMYITSVLWSDQSDVVVYRSFNDFREMHVSIKNCTIFSQSQFLNYFNDICFIYCRNNWRRRFHLEVNWINLARSYLNFKVGESCSV